MTASETTPAPTLPVPRPRTGRLVIASVPANHVYVRHLAPEDGSGPVRLPDPPPAGAAATQQWWPPVMLDPGWAATHDFDLFHLHFGFDACSPAELERLAAVLQRRGKPLVLTVHDLRNPHHEDRRAHDRQLDVLIPAADALVTLTPGAAREIRRRWGRRAVVLPHPHVVDLTTMGRASDPLDRTSFRVGLHVKSLRAGMDPLRILSTLVETVGELDGAVLQVNGHRDVLDPGGARHDRELAVRLRAHEARGDLELRVHDYFSDAELWRYLRGLDVSVLPYRFGTHSGWLEACRDLGTNVVAPSCGYFCEQGPVYTYVHDEDRFEPASLADALVMAYGERPGLGVTVAERRRQRDDVARGYDAVYRSVLADR